MKRTVSHGLTVNKATRNERQNKQTENSCIVYEFEIENWFGAFILFANNLLFCSIEFLLN